MALMLAAGGVKADGLQIYGILDNSVEYLSNAGVGANGGKASLLRISNGSQAPNRFGFKGSEDLGGGLKAIMQLEAGFNLDSGQLQQGGRMFGRQAYVGLQNSWGALSVGRQKNLIYDAFLELDPLSYYSYSLPALDAQFVGKADNAIKYAGNVNGFKVAGLFSTGYDATIANGAQVPGEWRVGKEYSVSVGYASGPLNASLVYDRQQGTTVATQGPHNAACGRRCELCARQLQAVCRVPVVSERCAGRGGAQRIVFRGPAVPAGSGSDALGRDLLPQHHVDESASVSPGGQRGVSAVKAHAVVRAGRLLAQPERLQSRRDGVWHERCARQQSIGRGGGAVARLLTLHVPGNKKGHPGMSFSASADDPLRVIRAMA
ncbi:porin [Pandoraea anhela]|nr:porin [Pandoraea anhela]